MDVKQFLRAILPSEGYYLVASYNAKNPKANEEHVVETIDEMVTVAKDIDSRGKDVFYALGSLDKQGIKVQKLNKADGSMYEAIEKRTKANIRHISVLFIEIDVEPSGIKKGKPCFASQEEALVATKEFCKSTGLPKPTVVNSGGGLHVYWRMDGNVSPDDQARLTSILRVLVTSEMPKVADVGVMTDYARVLRVPETHNYKQEQPRPVTVLTLGQSNPYELYETVLEARASQLNLRTNKQKSLSLPSHLANVENTIGLQFDDIPPLRPSKVLSTCQQIKWAAENPNDVSEPLWVSCIRVLQKCENSDDVIHSFSSGYAGYSEAETAAKIIHIKNNYPSPVSCATIEAERFGGCDNCPHQGKGSSPAWLSRDIAVAPPPTMQIVTEIDGAEVSQEVQILNPPDPYMRTMDGKIVMQYDRADGQTDVINVSPYDMYPTTRREDVGIDEYTSWQIKIPLKGWISVEIPASTLIDTSKLNNLLLRNSVYLPPLQREHAFKFMIAYIQHIQTQVKAEKHYATLGWYEDRSIFVLNEKTITEAGVNVAPIGKNVVEKHVGTLGSFDEWKQNMNFYNIKGYEDRQFAIMIGFASVLFDFTQFKGLVVNLDGEPGTGKTSLQWAANSIWGHPEEMMGNGGKGGATAVGLFGKLARHKNILLCLDEISTKESDEMGVFIHSIAQGQGKLRHKDWGDPETWKTPVMTSSNGSVFHKISQAKVNNSGEAARLFEIYIEPSELRSKKEADLFKRNIVNHYGHAGVKFIEFVMANKKKVEELIHAKIVEVDELSNASSGERFRTCLVALVWVACMICKKANILDWEVEPIVRFGIGHVTSLRGITDNYKSTPVDVLSDFLDALRPNILVLTGVNNSKHMGAGEILFMPIQKLLGRHELDLNEIYVNRKAFQDYCGQIKADYKAIELALLKEGILKRIDAQKSLGANTYLDKSVSRCWIIDLKHSMLTEKAEDLQMVMQHQAQAAQVMQPIT